MKILMIIAIVGLLAVAGLTVASAIDVDEPVEEEVSSCGGGCSAGQTCSNTGCAAKVGGSCGCGK